MVHTLNCIDREYLEFQDILDVSVRAEDIMEDITILVIGMKMLKELEQTMYIKSLIKSYRNDWLKKLNELKKCCNSFVPNDLIVHSVIN